MKMSRISRRNLLGGVVSAALLRGQPADANWSQIQAAGSTAPAWYPLPVGGGGYQSKLSIHPSGVILSGPDAYGCYRSSTTLGTINTQLQTALTMPASFLPSPYIAGDSYDLAIDPNNANTFWWYWSCDNALVSTVLKSTNQGGNWSTTGFPITAAQGNGNLHGVIRQMIAPDPNNSSNVVYVGGYDALRVTFNGGATFATVSGITAPGTDPGVCAIQFDPTSGTTTNGGVTVTARILLSVYGTGVYVSTNGGASFSLISGSPTGVTKSCMGSDGNYYAVSYGVSTIVRISTANAMTTITCNIGVGNLALNPVNPAHAIAWDQFGGGAITFNGPINSGSPTGTHNGFAMNPLVAPDVPWLAVTTLEPSSGPMDWDPFVTTSTTSLTIGTGSKTLLGIGVGLNLIVGDSVRISNTGTPTNYMRGVVTAYTSASGGSLTYTVGNDDPLQYLGAQAGGSGTFAAWQITKDRFHYCCGYGRLYIDAPTANSPPTYVSQTSGIESLSSCAVLWPPGHDPQLIASDFAWRTQTSNPIGQTTGNASYQPAESYGTIADGNFMCFAVSDPATLFGVSVVFIGKSTNEGASWTALASTPAAVSTYGSGAWIAASTPLNIVVTNFNLANYTTDGGVTWQVPTGFPTVSSGAFRLWGNPLVADSVTVGKFYVIDNGGAFHVSTDGGATWTATGGSVAVTYPNLVAVPGHAGHLLYATGQVSGSGSTPAAIVASSPQTGFVPQFSANGGATWTPLPNVEEAICIACGAAKPGGNGYPSFAFAAWVSGVYGLWRCDNFDPANIAGSTYVNIGTWPNDMIDTPVSIAGDSLNWDWWIISQKNSGWRARVAPGRWP